MMAALTLIATTFCPMDNKSKSKHLGLVDMPMAEVSPRADDPEEEARQQRVKQMPSLDQCYNLTDFEVEP